MALSRRLRILEALIRAGDAQAVAAIAQAEAMTLLLDPAPLSAPPPEDARVTTLSRSVADPTDAAPLPPAPHASTYPTRAFQAFNLEAAKREIAKAWAIAKTRAEKDSVRATAIRLQERGLLSAADVIALGPLGAP